MIYPPIIIFLTAFFHIGLSAQTYNSSHTIPHIEHDSCVHTGPSTVKQIIAVQSALQPNLSSPEESRPTASCTNMEPPSLQEMTKWLEDWIQQDKGPALPPSSEPFLKNENPKMVKLFRELTKNFDEPIQTECENVICVSRQIFGEKQGIQLLYMLGKYGFNGSPFPFKREGDRELWSSEELGKVLTALSHFPENVLPFIYNRALIRYKKGYTKAKYAKKYSGTGICVRANSFIEVFDCINRNYFVGPDIKFVQTIVHEVAHVIGSEAELDTAGTWLDFSGWEETKTYQDDEIHTSYELKNPECAVSEYGKTSPVEDFAESVVAYRYNPNFLKTKCPGKYYYIQDLVFKGAEYTQEQVCRS